MDKRLENLRKHQSPEHWQKFAEFCEWEMASGGPDPHLKAAALMAKGEDWTERLWRGGCYIGVYNVPTAERIWQEWPYSRALKEDMLPWIKEHWEGLATRRERKSVRVKENMGVFFRDFAQWVRSVEKDGRAWMSSEYKTVNERYDLAYQDVTGSVKYLGRYIAMKLLEYGRVALDWPIESYDIYAQDPQSWSPRSMLALLYPQLDEKLTSNKPAEYLYATNRLATSTRTLLKEKFGVDVNYYDLQVMLCEYRESYVGRRMHPGKSQDSELEYAAKIKPYWGDRPSDLWKARRAISPPEFLGEIQGWPGVRKDVCRVLRDFGYTWSDALYDYNATKDFAAPVRR